MCFPKFLVVIIISSSFPGTNPEDDSSEDYFFSIDQHYGEWGDCNGSEKYPDAKLNKTWYDEKNKIGWYYVMGNQWQIVLLSDLLKKHISGLGDIEYACFTNRRTDKGVEITGYNGTKIEYDCKTKGQGCTDSTRLTRNAAVDSTVVAWTDNKKYVLEYGCSNYRVTSTMFLKTWSLRSIENANVDETTKKEVVAQILKNGFTDYHVVQINREVCPTP